MFDYRCQGKQSIGYLALLVLVFFLPSTLPGQDVYTINEDDLSVKLDTFWKLTMSGEPLSIDEAVNSDEFELVADSLIKQEILTTNWIRFRLANPSSRRRNFYLCFMVLDHYTIRAYSVDEQGVVVGLDTLGAQEPFFERAISTRLPIIPVGIEPGEEKTVFIYLDRKFLPYKGQMIIVPEEAVLPMYGEQNFLSGAIMGVMFLHLILALTMALVFWKRAMFYYLLYVSGLSLFALYSRSLGQTFFLWFGDNGSSLFDCLPYCSTLLLVIGHTGIFRHFFQLKALYPRLNSILCWYQVAAFLVIISLLCWQPIVTLWPRGYQFLVYLEFILALTSTLIIVGTVFFWFKEPMKVESYWFMAVFFPTLSISLCLWGMDQQLIPYWEWMEQKGAGLILAIEGVMLSFLLIRRFFKEQKEVSKKMRNERKEVVNDLHSGLSPDIVRLEKIHNEYLKPLGSAVYEDARAIDFDLEASIRSFMWVVDAGNDASFAALAAKLRETVRKCFYLEKVNAEVITTPSILSEESGLPFLTNYHICHIVKQVASNCSQHANANNFVIQIRFDDEKFYIKFLDDGVGFDTENPKKVKDGDHHGRGLGELESRAKKIGGTIKTESVIGKGTVTHLAVPLHEEINYTSRLFTP